MMHRLLVALVAAVAASGCRYTVQMPPPGTIDVVLVQAPTPTLTIEASPDAADQTQRTSAAREPRRPWYYRDGQRWRYFAAEPTNLY